MTTQQQVPASWLSTSQPIKNLAISLIDGVKFAPALVGSISFTTSISGETSLLTCTNLTSGLAQTITVADVPNVVDYTFILQFSDLGIQVTGQTAVTYSSPAFSSVRRRSIAIAKSVCGANTNIRLRAALPVNINIPFGFPVIDNVLPSRTSAVLSHGNYIGWVMYAEPTQKDLSDDLLPPLNAWRPIVGEKTEIPLLTTTKSKAIQAERAAPLVLPSGIAEQKYDYTWGAYSLVQDVFVQKKYSGEKDSCEFAITGETSVDFTRLKVYVNGIYTSNAKVTSLQNVVSCASLVVAVGDTITVVYAAYQPTAADLSFDPDSNPKTDNPIKTKQYAKDYQFTVRHVRNDAGELKQVLYYFWVANKNLVTKNRSLSLQTAKNGLTTNTNPFAVLQNLDSGTNPVYSQFVCVGLNKYITEDNTYKIRFTRDFVLRDSVKLGALKNVHAEWAMIRENQTTRIPEKLWTSLVDAACGNNMRGDPIPSSARVAYDSRNGTKLRFGFADDQALVAQELALSSTKHTILNTTLTTTLANSTASIPDLIDFIDDANIEYLFSTPALTRATMWKIFNKAKPKHANEIFFAVLHDALSDNYEFTDIFKTSMIAAHSIRLITEVQGGAK